MDSYKKYQNPLNFLKDVVLNPIDLICATVLSYATTSIAPLTIPSSIGVIREASKDNRSDDSNAAQILGTGIGISSSIISYLGLLFGFPEHFPWANELNLIRDQIFNYAKSNPITALLPITTNLGSLAIELIRKDMKYKKGLEELANIEAEKTRFHEEQRLREATYARAREVGHRMERNGKKPPKDHWRLEVVLRDGKKKNLYSSEKLLDQTTRKAFDDPKAVRVNIYNPEGKLEYFTEGT